MLEDNERINLLDQMEYAKRVLDDYRSLPLKDGLTRDMMSAIEAHIERCLKALGKRGNLTEITRLIELSQGIFPVTPNLFTYNVMIERVGMSSLYSGVDQIEISRGRIHLSGHNIPFANLSDSTEGIQKITIHRVADRSKRGIDEGLLLRQGNPSDC